jgi:hypothetical protein
LPGKIFQSRAEIRQNGAEIHVFIHVENGEFGAAKDLELGGHFREHDLGFRIKNAEFGGRSRQHARGIGQTRGLCQSAPARCESFGIEAGMKPKAGVDLAESGGGVIPGGSDSQHRDVPRDSGNHRVADPFVGGRIKTGIVGTGHKGDSGIYSRSLLALSLP